MDDHLTRARYYREEAETIRRLASNDNNLATREGLLSIALAYDRLSAKYSAMTEPMQSYMGSAAVQGKGKLR